MFYWYTVKYKNFEEAKKFPRDFANFQNFQEGKIIPVDFHDFQEC